MVTPLLFISVPAVAAFAQLMAILGVLGHVQHYEWGTYIDWRQSWCAGDPARLSEYSFREEKSMAGDEMKKLGPLALQIFDDYVEQHFKWWGPFRWTSLPTRRKAWSFCWRAWPAHTKQVHRMAAFSADSVENRSPAMSWGDVWRRAWYRMMLDLQLPEGILAEQLLMNADCWFARRSRSTWFGTKFVKSWWPSTAESTRRRRATVLVRATSPQLSGAMAREALRKEDYGQQEWWERASQSLGGYGHITEDHIVYHHMETVELYADEYDPAFQAMVDEGLDEENQKRLNMQLTFCRLSQRQATMASGVRDMNGSSRSMEASAWRRNVSTSKRSSQSLLADNVDKLDIGTMTQSAQKGREKEKAKALQRRLPVRPLPRGTVPTRARDLSPNNAPSTLPSTSITRSPLRTSADTWWLASLQKMKRRLMRFWTPWSPRHKFNKLIEIKLNEFLRCYLLDKIYVLAWCTSWTSDKPGKWWRLTLWRTSHWLHRWCNDCWTTTLRWYATMRLHSTRHGDAHQSEWPTWTTTWRLSTTTPILSGKMPIKKDRTKDCLVTHSFLKLTGSIWCDGMPKPDKAYLVFLTRRRTRFLKMRWTEIPWGWAWALTATSSSIRHWTWSDAWEFENSVGSDPFRLRPCQDNYTWIQWPQAHHQVQGLWPALAWGVPHANREDEDGFA